MTSTRCCSDCLNRQKKGKQTLKKRRGKGAHITVTFDENTIPPSDRVSAPSQSYFSVPYTDGFTDVCDTESAPLVSARRDKDTGYSSSAGITVH